MKIFATKVCIKGRLASFNGTRSGKAVGVLVGVPNGASLSSSESESVSVRMGSVTLDSDRGKRKLLRQRG